MNTPAPLRWTAERAAAEFGVDRRTMRRRLLAAHVVAGPDAKFSTAQICQAVFSDKHHEQTRETTERADKLAMANANARSELIERSAVDATWAEIVGTAKARLGRLSATVGSKLRLTPGQERELEAQIAEGLGELDKVPDYHPKD